jgi:tripartite-type tricarboxylate transporter receptor subunit TctC
MKQPFRFILAILAVGLPLSAALAQPYPHKPIRMVVPFAAGGGLDSTARIIAPKLAEFLNQAVVVENRPGASGFIGTGYVAKAEPDGYTILYTPNGHVIAPALYRKLPFNPSSDFAAVTQVVNTTLVLVENPKVPAQTLGELIALAKSKPGVLNYGSPGVADPLHLVMEMLKISSGTDIVPVLYKGQAAMGAAILSGEVELAVVSLSSNLPHIRKGGMRALAVTGAKRAEALPEIPTIAESGFPGFDLSSWHGIFAPAGTPRDVVNRLQRETLRVLNSPDTRERLRSLGLEPIGSTPEEFDAKVKSDIAKFMLIVKQAGIPPQD